MKFIDLFCGIGGFRLGMQKAGFECVFSAEINEHACAMYENNFSDNPLCDVTTLKPESLPEFDIMCGGFPCQAFSLAGRQQGFNDTRGTLFFDLCRIIEARQPKVVFLENVKHLIYHDGGKTFRVIQEQLEKLGYTIAWKVLNASSFGVPQHRERIVIIALRQDLNKTFDFNQLITHAPVNLRSILEDKEHTYLEKSEYTLIEAPKRQKSGLIFAGFRNKNMRKVGIRPDTEHLSRVHKQSNRIYDTQGVHPTLSSQESAGRFWIHEQGQVRKLTMTECFRLMGFPEDFKKHGSQANLYARIGNSVCVNMIEAVAQALKKQV